MAPFTELLWLMFRPADICVNPTEVWTFFLYWWMSLCVEMALYHSLLSSEKSWIQYALNIISMAESLVHIQLWPRDLLVVPFVPHSLTHSFIHSLRGLSDTFPSPSLFHHTSLQACLKQPVNAPRAGLKLLTTAWPKDLGSSLKSSFRFPSHTLSTSLWLLPVLFKYSPFFPNFGLCH